jgi:hypothetical protein
MNPTYDDLDELKELLAGYRKALDEENYEEAESQAYRAVMVSEVSFPVSRCPPGGGGRLFWEKGNNRSESSSLS